MTMVKYTARDWEIVKAFYEHGLCAADIARRPECRIKNRSMIYKKIQSMGWEKGKNKHLFDKEVKTIATINEINQEKLILNPTELKVHDILISERIAIASEIAKFSLQAARKGAAMLESIESAVEFKALVDGMDKISITSGVNERHAKPTQINNTTQTANFNGMTDDDLLKEAKVISDRLTQIV